MGNGCCGGSSSASVIIQARKDLEGSGGNGNMNTQIDPNAEMVRMEYFGPRIGAVTYHGKKRHYRFGNNAIDRYDDVNPEDVETLLSQPGFRVLGQDVQKYQAPGVEFIPEPAGEFIPDVALEEPEIVDIPAPVDEVFSSETIQSGEPPALDIEPLPDTVKEIKAAVIGANLDTLLAWLREEQENKKRKTAFEAIEKALEENFS